MRGGDEKACRAGVVRAASQLSNKVQHHGEYTQNILSNLGLILKSRETVSRVSYYIMPLWDPAPPCPRCAAGPASAPAEITYPHAPSRVVATRHIIIHTLVTTADMRLTPTDTHRLKATSVQLEG